MTRKYLMAAIAVFLVGIGPAQAGDTEDVAADVVATEETLPTLTTELEADTEAGEKLYRRECRGCHGPTAKGLASYPKLVGNPPAYIVGRLIQYRSGEKLGPNTPLMAPRAKKLSDQDITNLAGFITSLPEE